MFSKLFTCKCYLFIYLFIYHQINGPFLENKSLILLQEGACLVRVPCKITAPKGIIFTYMHATWENEKVPRGRMRRRHVASKPPLRPTSRSCSWILHSFSFWRSIFHLLSFFLTCCLFCFLLFAFPPCSSSLKIMIVGCVDSRVDQALTLGLGFGEAFILRNVANLIHPKHVI